jgi:hypothetical protein
MGLSGCPESRHCVHAMSPPHPPPSVIKPPERLGEFGRMLWHELQSDYHITDAAGLTVLAQACAAFERAEGLARRIDVDGEVINSPSGPRPHPAIAGELAARALVCRLLKQLGLTLEPLMPVGHHRGRPRSMLNADQ